MIVLNIETSRIDKVKCGVWQIGAIDLDSGEEFLQESRIDDEDQILNMLGIKPVLEVIGKTEEELRDNSKRSQRELLENFFKWVEERTTKNFLCQNPQFDVGFLDIKANKYNLKTLYHHRSFDLHNLAQVKYYDLHGKFSIKEGCSDFGLTNILEFCGLEDNRQAHNALEDAKLTAECFSRLVYKKSLFEEFSKFPVPDYLSK